MSALQTIPRGLFLFLSQCSTVFAMRLSNDSDQAIIRSAIPNSSSSTTSFLASIGNGEAIAFGEAISVPMRLRFNRVADNILPKANGIAPVLHEDGPDTVDLRSIVKRMRAVSGPDISGFRQSYDTAVAKDYEDGEADGWPYPSGETDTGSHEPYRPDMLPRAATAPSTLPGSQQPSLKEALLKMPLGSLYRKD